MNRLTQMEDLHLKGQINQQKILYYVKIDEHRYNEVVLETGVRFLDKLFPIGSEFEASRSLHEADKLFWNWFRMQWIMVETQFLATTEELFPLPSFVKPDWKRSWLQALDLHLVKSDRIDHAFSNYLSMRSASPVKKKSQVFKRTERMHAILKFISSRPASKRKEIAAHLHELGFRVSVVAVDNDLWTLRQNGCAVEAKTKGSGFRIEVDSIFNGVRYEKSPAFVEPVVVKEGDAIGVVNHVPEQKKKKPVEHRFSESIALKILSLICTYPGSSCADLSAQLENTDEGHSESGIYNQIHELRKRGAEITGSQTQGYTLAKDFEYKGTIIYPKTPAPAKKTLEDVELKTKRGGAGSIAKSESHKSSRIHDDPKKELKALEKKDQEIMEWIRIHGTSHPEFMDKVSERNSISVQMEVKRQQISGTWKDPRNTYQQQ